MYHEELEYLNKEIAGLNQEYSKVQDSLTVVYEKRKELISKEVQKVIDRNSNVDPFKIPVEDLKFTSSLGELETIDCSLFRQDLNKKLGLFGYNKYPTIALSKDASSDILTTVARALEFYGKNDLLCEFENDVETQFNGMSFVNIMEDSCSENGSFFMLVNKDFSDCKVIVSRYYRLYVQAEFDHLLTALEYISKNVSYN